jgi:hypothetical protein
MIAAPTGFSPQILLSTILIGNELRVNISGTVYDVNKHSKIGLKTFGQAGILAKIICFC